MSESVGRAMYDSCCHLVLPLAVVGVGGSCSNSSECVVNSVCAGSVCVCGSGFHASNGSCSACKWSGVGWHVLHENARAHGAEHVLQGCRGKTNVRAC